MENEINQIKTILGGMKEDEEYIIRSGWNNDNTILRNGGSRDVDLFYDISVLFFYMEKE